MNARPIRSINILLTVPPTRVRSRQGLVSERGVRPRRIENPRGKNRPSTLGNETQDSPSSPRRIGLQIRFHDDVERCTLSMRCLAVDTSGQVCSKCLQMQRKTLSGVVYRA